LVDQGFELSVIRGQQIDFASAERDDVLAPGLEPASHRAANEPGRSGNQEPPHQISSSGIATTNLAPHCRAYASWAAISSRRFQGKMMMKSGLSESMRSGAV